MKEQPCTCLPISPCPKKVPIFSSLSDEEIAKVAKMSSHQRFAKGEALIHEGETADTLFIINHGQVKLLKLTIDGKEQILNILTSGDFFGESHLFATNMINNFSVYAIDDTEICLLTKQDFDLLLKDNPDIAIKLLSVLTNRLVHIENLAQNLATKDPSARIVQIILQFCEKFGKRKNGEIEIDLPLSREEIASYAGVTRETISRKLRMFEDLGLITAIGNKRLIVKDETALREFI
ncbi:cAMP-binding protein [Ammoniphilus oxalaticus]|uniref:cAMP-binding protein n=1 Tax=Ammoniphilus oxalaticus TaxID=66863 RepID=A0A419SP37_9BACL|nr:Crp/Fnr family transcriptional regulator [Ammoniphilus oxalaticus]RKD26002.1 cAMP-binding protein [Ammoniphilus oxalaticus]